MKKFFILFVLSLAFGSCSPFQKAFKSEDVSVKYSVAEKLYEKGKYSKSIRLFEQMTNSFKGKPQAEKMFYMYSQALYKTKDYYTAGYQFEKFTSSYPKSEKVEETAYLGAFCYSKLSPEFSLDQIDTEKAIDKMQSFIDRFPESARIAEANVVVKEMREKIERKAFENAKQYNQISDFKSALVSLDNFIADFPGTPYKSEALFYKFDSAYRLAINSVPSKMEERLNNAKVIYNSFVKFDSNSKFKPRADVMLAEIDKTLTTIVK